VVDILWVLGRGERWRRRGKGEEKRKEEEEGGERNRRTGEGGRGSQLFVECGI